MPYYSALASLPWHFLGACLLAAGASLAADDFYTPASVQLRQSIAQGASAGLDSRLASALVEAARASEMNDQDATKAITTIAAGLLPWANATRILFPKVPGVAVPVWPAGPPFNLSLDPRLNQPIPPTTSPTTLRPSACCARLEALGFRSNLPVVVADTGGRVVRLHSPVPVAICTCGGQDFEGAAALDIRGSSSAVQMVKKSFGIKFRSLSQSVSPKGRKGSLANVTAVGGSASNWTLGSKIDVPFLGMAQASSWVLYGDDDEGTLGMRNALALDLTRAMGRWAPNTIFCELFLVQDGQPLSVRHYWGPYLAMEKIEVHPNRLNLAVLNAKRKDLSGGYVLGYERSLWPTDVRVTPANWTGTRAPTTLRSTGTIGAVGVGIEASACPSGDGRNLTYILHEPSAEGAYLEQQRLGPKSNDTRLVAWAARYLGSVEAALVNDTLPATGAAVPPGGGGWRALVHEGAFIDYFLSQEVPKNPDANRGSVYMWKEQSRPLVLGPPWDFNEAFGMCCGYPIAGWDNGGVSNGTSGGSAISPEGWRVFICDEPQRCVVDPVDGISLWWRATWKREPAFRLAVAMRWQSLRQAALSNQFFKQRFDFYRERLQFAAPRNSIRWAAVLPDPTTPAERLYTQSVQQLQGWTFARLAWMDAALTHVASEAAAVTQPREPLPGAEATAIMAAVVTCANQAATMSTG